MDVCCSDDGKGTGEWTANGFLVEEELPAAAAAASVVDLAVSMSIAWSSVTPLLGEEAGLCKALYTPRPYEECVCVCVLMYVDS